MPAGIALCIPSSGRPVTPRWGLSVATITWPLNTTVHYFMIEGQPVETVRERLIEQALERDVEYIFFLDDDVIVNRMSIQRLMYSLQNEPQCGVMCGIYVTKTDVPVPLVFRKNGGGAAWDWKHGDVFEIDGAGAGCMLIRAEVFRKMPKPWFAWRDQMAEDSVLEHHITTGEDIYFCQKAKEAGFKVMADGGVLCLHWDAPTNRFYRVPPDSYPLRDVDAKAATP